MQGNDIGFTIHKHVACWFEGLLVDVNAVPIEEEKPGLLKRLFTKEQEKEPLDAGWKSHMVSRWSVNELPLKSVIHLSQQLGIAVEVYTYYEDALRETIEHYLARKGADVQVYCYGGLVELMDDMKYNRDVHTLYTPYEADAKAIGWHRATVVLPSGTFGI